jgi:hypothetical protein
MDRQFGFLTDSSSQMRGLYVDRVLLHPMADLRARQAAIPCEKPYPTKLT